MYNTEHKQRSQCVLLRTENLLSKQIIRWTIKMTNISEKKVYVYVHVYYKYGKPYNCRHVFCSLVSKWWHTIKSPYKYTLQLELKNFGQLAIIFDWNLICSIIYFSIPHESLLFLLYFCYLSTLNKLLLIACVSILCTIHKIVHKINMP